MNDLAPTDSLHVEIDYIYSLLSYAIVYQYWENNDRNGRGYNVGCILVDPNNTVVDWGINTVNATENCTQHGEVRLITSYLSQDGIYSLDGYSIYSTLEPCAMCAGMMTMASIKRVVSGQKDYYFSKAIERLSFDSTPYGGYPPYPRIVASHETPTEYGDILDKSYQAYIKAGNQPIITKFLSTPPAKEIYAKAFQSFMAYQVRYKPNQAIYEKALLFFNHLPPQPK